MKIVAKTTALVIAGLLATSTFSGVAFAETTPVCTVYGWFITQRPDRH